MIYPAQLIERSIIEPYWTPIVRLTSNGFGDRTQSNSPQNFANRTQSNVEKSNTQTIVHYRTFENRNTTTIEHKTSFVWFQTRRCVQISYVLAQFNFKHLSRWLLRPPRFLFCRWCRWKVYYGVKRGDRDPALKVTDETWTFAMWTGACALAIYRRSWGVRL